MLDLDKAMENFLYTTNILDCQVDPTLAKDLQPLLQFTSDLALYLILMLAQNTKVNSNKHIFLFLYTIILVNTSKLPW